MDLIEGASAKKTLLWVGDDYRSLTGYGRVARELFVFLKNVYTIVHYSISYEGPTDEYLTINSSDGTGFGFNKLPSLVNNVKPDIIILLNDSAIISGWLQKIQNECTHKCVIIPYLCTEYTGVRDSDVELYNATTNGMLAMATFTLTEIIDKGYKHNTLRLSHGCSKGIKKIDKSYAKSLLGINPETFVFFSGSKNQPRKRLDIIIRAFVNFLKKHNEEYVVLMMNCGLVDMGWNIKELYDRLCKENNITNKDRHLYLCSNNIKDANKSDDELTVIYNACDVGITTSTGESFGLVPFEQAALGVPQIIPNFSGIIEAITQGSINLAAHDYYVYPVVLQSACGEGQVVNHVNVTEAMEMYYTKKDVYQLHQRLIINNVLNFTWENISIELIKFIETLITPNNKPIELKQIELK
jgi:glycosyltransferase involved in cell wall biosynthesis